MSALAWTGGALSLSVFSVGKNGADENEDRFAFDLEQGVIAVSDGASVSFAPAIWADVLVRRIVANPAVSEEWIARAIAEHDGHFDRATMPWMIEAAFDSGSFATLLAIKLGGEAGVPHVLAVGDSLCAVISSDGVVFSTPYSRAEEFDQRPRLLSSNQAQNRQVLADAAELWRTLHVDFESQKLLLMTDSLGRWLLDEPGPARVECLASLSTQSEFAIFVEDEIRERRLKKDDATLVILRRQG
jgi:hypothetical protein